MFALKRILHRGDDEPRQVLATVADRRTHVTRRHCATCAVDKSQLITTCYVTFRLHSGEELELSVPVDLYGILVEGERGNLIFRGNKFLEFEPV